MKSPSQRFQRNFLILREEREGCHGPKHVNVGFKALRVSAFVVLDNEQACKARLMVCFTHREDEHEIGKFPRFQKSKLTAKDLQEAVEVR
eukprot:CAMPEP_0195011800 /NCGR_PEP_ID=MMETSP0326_2-20130528/11287_1 /TAXON_ID=2866 ORGANISM="Crypthecodinium cohnii, Strain Seligo" /NCGR_SAMPLE_ID=MMETSP0326_2 /ASSEMBLY_ACC=CAM_ASM_000348 /LENGTH=89 /DNA_ID=CAMNT_0040021127 /DNA_START=411 /DNA_END=676 /DNA_ORIENTATION=-